ncbi:MAG: TatD family nuclease-associated radical SAM protein [Elusimicrobiota bacterium]
MEFPKPEIVYRYKTGLYVNLTNCCPTACVFCIKSKWKMAYRGSNLDLGGAEPDAKTVTSLIKTEWTLTPFDELVFCGYGEPTMRLDTLIAIAKAVKTGALAPVPAGLRVRLNTNGLGGLVNGTDIVPRLKGLVDAVHVSLNTPDPLQWLALMRPKPEYEQKAFNSVLEFVRGAARVIPETVVTAIDGAGVDIVKFEALAKELGVKTRIRARLEI